ncbi:MAG: hypothetical protein AAGK22_19370 [Acidobacteriota bacterium]
MSLPDGFASSCWRCGAAIHPLSEICGACSASYAPASVARRRLDLHRARMVRAIERLRAGVAFRVATSLTQRHIPKLLLLVLGGVLVTLAATMVVTVIGVLKHEQLGTLAYVVIAAAVLLAVGGVVGSLVSALVSLRILAGRADRMARRCVRDWVATESMACASCGGRFETVTYSEEGRVPCPWCDVDVAPSERDGSDPTVAVARETAIRHKEELGPKAYRHLLRKLGRRPLRELRVPLPGFSSRAGLIAGEPEGVPMWSALEYVDSEPTLRLEIDAPTRFSSVWYVRPAVESDLRSAADLWGISLPRERAEAQRSGWAAYARDEVLPEGAALEAVLDALGPRDALLLDVGGVSVWRRSGNFVALFRPWLLVRDVLQPMLAFLRGVRAEPLEVLPMESGPRAVSDTAEQVKSESS